MTVDKLKSYNVTLQDFNDFYLSFEVELINELYDLKLLEDFNFKNIDTKKTIHFMVIKKIVSKLQSKNNKHIFLIKPEIISNNCEIMNHLDKFILRRELMKLFKFLIKNKYNTFIFLNKSYSDFKSDFNLDSPDIRDFLDIQLAKTTMKIIHKEEIVNNLFNKFSKNFKK